MREIKFRAWDLVDGKFRDIQTIEFWEGGMRVALWDGIVTENRDDGEDLILLQFTGLHDKNGKEIYEGDIVKGDTGVGGSVDFLFGCWHIKDFERNGHYLLYPTKNGDFTALKNGGIFGWLEVIGNIYENPELLK